MLGLASFLRPLASLEVSGGPRLLRLLAALEIWILKNRDRDWDPGANPYVQMMVQEQTKPRFFMILYDEFHLEFFLSILLWALSVGT